MQDISSTLNTIMRNENCSSIRAFFLFCGRGGDNVELYRVQSESEKKIGGRLCDTGNIEEYE